MTRPKYIECPYCCERIREQAKVCRFCHAILTEEPVRPVFVEDKIAERDQEDAPFAGIEREFRSRGVRLTEENWNRVKRILGSAPEEYRMATVLFVDLTGYTRISAEVCAEDMKEYLEAFYDHCVHAVSIHNGFVVKFVGDAVLAVFGAPVAYDRDAESAVRAALMIRDQVSVLPPIRGERLTIKVGLHTGEILSSVVTVQGKESSFDVFGNAVNLACRLESIGRDGEILLSEETHEMVQDVFECRRKRRVRVKGIADPITPYEVLGLKDSEPVRRDFQIPFVGRANEVETVRSFCAQEESPPILALVGEPGIGKSRILHEALSGRSGEYLIAVECHPETARIPYYVFSQLVRTHLQITDDRGLHVKRQVGDFSLEFPQFDAEDLLYIKYLLGDAYGVKALESVSPSAFRASLKNVLYRFLIAISARRPVVLCVDDLQWADQASLDMLSELLEVQTIKGVRLIVLYRSSFEPSWKSPEGIERLAIEELSASDRQEMLKQFLANRDLLPEVRKAILERSNGNPFYIEQITKSFLREYDQLDDEQRSEKSREILRVLPASVKEIIQARIDVLESQTKKVLQCASVLGLTFTFDLIRIYEFIRDNLLQELYALEGLEFLSAHRAKEDLRFAFKHPLTQEVAYHSLLRRRRQELHLIIAKRLESSQKGNLSKFYDILAFHYGQTEDHDKAVYYLQKAGDKARAMCANRTALELYDEALSRLRGLSPTTERQLQVARMLIDRARLYRFLGETGETYESLEGCKKIVDQSCDDAIHGHYLYEIGLTHHQAGNYEVAEESLLHALEVWQGLRSLQQIALVKNGLGMVSWVRGNLQSAEEAFLDVVYDQSGEVSSGVQGDAANNLALIYWKRGDYAKARETFQIALRLRREGRDRFGTGATLMNLGIIDEHVGHYDQARANYTNALKLMSQLEYAQGLTALHANIANLELKCRDYQAAQEHSTRSLLIAQEIQDPRSEAIAFENLGLGFAALGDEDSALDSFEKAVRIAEELGDEERLLSVKLGEMEVLAKRNGGRIGIGEVAEVAERVRALQIPDQIPRALRLQGKLMEMNGSVDEALAACRAAINAAEQLGNHDEIEQSLLAALALCRKHKIDGEYEFETRLSRIEIQREKSV